MLVVEEGEGDDRVRWGTWEELLLGGAVLRHGYEDWDAVALELQTRAHHPYLFSPQVCKDKYEKLLKHYSGSSACFEELRKRRLDELRRALEQSEDSIGSLELKLESLKAKKEITSNSSSRVNSPNFRKSEGSQSAGREASNSFAEETETTWSLQCQVSTEVSCEKAERKPVLLKAHRLEKFPSIEKLAETILSEHGVSIRRRRGKRRRKDVKEGSVGENNLLGAADTVASLLVKDKLASGPGLPAKLLDGSDHFPCIRKQETDDFTKILDSIMENEHAAIFQHRLDSQKRARYKKMIRQHMDLDTIRLRIARKSITSSVELLRDLLLLANNALAFYSKSTREYKCALLFRDLVHKKSRQHHKVTCRKIAAPVEIPESPVLKPPAKPRSARPFKHKFGNKMVNGEIASVVMPVEHKRPPSNVGSPSSAESAVLSKKSCGKRVKVGRIKRGNAGIQAETPMKVRKQARVN